MQKMRHDIKSTWGSAALGSLYGPVKSSLGGAEPPLSDTRSNFLMIRVAGAQALTAFPGHSNTSLSRRGQEASLFSGAAESGGCLPRCPRPLLGLHPSVCKVSQSLDMRRVSALPLGEGGLHPASHPAPGTSPGDECIDQDRSRLYFMLLLPVKPWGPASSGPEVEKEQPLGTISIRVPRTLST